MIVERLEQVVELQSHNRFFSFKLFEKTKNKKVSQYNFILVNFDRRALYKCDQNGLFLKGLGDELSYKSSQNICWRLGYLKISLLWNTAVYTFWQRLEKLGYFYTVIW